MSAAERQPASAAARPGLRVSYRDDALEALLAAPQVLAVLGFGARAPAVHTDPRYFNVGLEPVGARAPFEVWEVDRAVRHGRDEGVAWARGGGLAFGAMAVEEAACGGITAAAEAAYTRLLDALASSSQPALLRSWNYVDAITEGEGDAERYRQFCLGRARAMAGRLGDYPAATAIGLRDGRRTLRLYWLAGAHPGIPVENPRQLAAWRYPRQYGPQSPTFARATLPVEPSLPLLLSGTASVVGHASAHDALEAQLAETFRNFASLLQAACARRPELPAGFGTGSVLKIYLRDADEHAHLEALLADQLPASTPRLVLAADICRRELQIEIDGFHG